MEILSITQLENRKSPWRVRYILGNQKKTLHFHSEELAQKWISENETQKLTPVDEVTDEEKLLLQLARLRCQHNGVPIRETIDEFLKFAEIPRTITLADAIAAYVDEMERRQLRPPYIRNAKYILNKFKNSRSDWPVASFQPEQVVNYCRLTQKGASNQNTVRSRLTTFFNFCVDRGWSSIDTSQIKWLRPKEDNRAINFWHPADVWRFIQSCPDKIRFGVALLFLSGIRPKGEFMQLTYDDIDPIKKTIHIPASASKTRRSRVLYDLGDLWKLYKPDEGRVCKMTYRNFRSHITRVCEKTGLEWSHDVSRHTFGTCAFHKSLEWAMDIMGHQRSSMLMKHYKGNIMPEEAKKLWICPD